jgi:CPA1 family monovalent cation:H+ antiporter
MTGGVVLATLLLNATTIGRLIHRLGLDDPSRPDRFLAAATRIHAGRAARERLNELGIQEEAVARRLNAVESTAREDLEQIELTPDEEIEVVIRQGLFVERQSYQRLSDAGLLQPTAARTLLHEVDEQIEEVGVGHVDIEALGKANPPAARSRAASHRAHPQPAGENAADIAYSEAMARRVAATRTLDALKLFLEFPAVHDTAVHGAQRLFVRHQRDANDALARLDADGGDADGEVHRRMADALTRVTATDALSELTHVGLLPEAVARDATRTLSAST